MDIETIKKSINDKFDDIESKIDILELEITTADNKEQICGYTINQLIKKIHELNNETLYAYIAGFFDGEGWIGTYTDKRKSTSMITLASSVTNTNIEILIKMKQIFNGRIHHTKKIENEKENWHWNISNRDELKNFLEKILPYSTVKKQQIKYGLKYLELTSSTRGKAISIEEQKIRNFISDKLKEMKNVEYTNKELSMFTEEIKNIDKDKNQLTMENY